MGGWVGVGGWVGGGRWVGGRGLGWWGGWEAKGGLRLPLKHRQQ